MHAWLLAFMKELERVLPPDGVHHALTYNQYGSEEHGYEDRLGLHIARGGMWQTFFLEPADFEKPVDELVGEIAAYLVTEHIGDGNSILQIENREGDGK